MTHQSLMTTAATPPPVTIPRQSQENLIVHDEKEADTWIISAFARLSKELANDAEATF
jgi:hypothetical protein